MKVTLNKQENGVNTLKEQFLKNSNKELKKFYIVCGEVKETGYDTIEECLIDCKAKKLIVFGIDKKNTTRKMLENLYKYTKSVYVYNNNGLVEIISNIFVFEFLTVAYVYTFAGSITASSIDTDKNMYTCIEYNLENMEDKLSYDEYVSGISKEVKEEGYAKLTKELIENLVEGKEIFTTKQYIHNVPSIAELLKSKEEDKTEKKQVEKPISKIKLDDLEDVSFEIDLGDMQDIGEITEEIEKGKAYVEDDIDVDTSNVKDKEVNASLFESTEKATTTFDDTDEFSFIDAGNAIDMENLIFESKAVKLDKKKVQKKVEKKEKQEKTTNSKKIDLSKVSNIVMELPKKPTKGQDVDSIKVPNYIKDMIPDFFYVMENGKLVERKEGTFKETTISLEVIDVNNGNKYVDKAAKLVQKKGQTYVMFESEKLIDVIYEELDIARIIKLSETSYHIEIIPQGIEEYKLWKKMCTNNFRGSSRQFGLM